MAHILEVPEPVWRTKTETAPRVRGEATHNLLQLRYAVLNTRDV